ncbi:MAG: ketopantoate reductase family protein [Trebonia sp.]
MTGQGKHQRTGARPAEGSPAARVLVCGAGVIGRVYAARLADAGHDVTLLARGGAVAELAERGVTLRSAAGGTIHASPAVVSEVPAGAAYDIALVTVRRDQLDGIMPLVERVPAAGVAFLVNQPADPAAVLRRTGPERAVLAFPGVGGYREADGAIRYLEIPQQKTTVDDSGAAGRSLVGLLRSARLPVAVSGDMPGWLRTHVVFIAAAGAAILGQGGDSAALAADRDRVAAMVAAVGDGFLALGRGGSAVIPGPLRFMFTRMPRPIAVRYWQAQLRGPVGTVAIAPHIRATRDTEFPRLCADVRQLVAAHGPTPHLHRLLDSVA